MFEIKGKINTAVCYATNVESVAIEQIREMCSYEFTSGSKIRIMPDVHAGTGCTVGTTMTITDRAVPNVVGVDIGCGMYTVNLGSADIDLAAFDEIVHLLPAGNRIWNSTQEKFVLENLACYRELNNVQRLKRSLGTLGGGNHFIEIDRASDGTNFLIIHSGSRSLGCQVSEFYQKLAIRLNYGYGDFLDEKNEIIASYKKQGRRSELSDVIKKMKWDRGRQINRVPDEFCWLSGKYLDDYLHDVDICQKFAERNREIMAEFLLQRAGLKGTDCFHTIHNYIDVGEKILRKGAIAAHKGEKVLIPINMRDGSILAVGRGNPDWNYSAPHGAGRLYSRSTAKNTITLDEYRESMKGIYTTSVNEFTLDEAPMAYKSIDDIIGTVSETVDVVEVLKPVYNFKA